MKNHGKESKDNSFLNEEDLSLFRKLLLLILKPGIALKDKKAVSIEEAALLFGVGKSTIQKLINNRKLKTFKMESRRLISMETIDMFILTAEEEDLYGQ